MTILFFMGLIFFLIGYFGFSTVDATNPVLTTRDTIITIILLLGIICLTSSITLYIDLLAK